LVLVVGIVSALAASCVGTLHNGYSFDIRGAIRRLHEMSEKGLDGKAELERALQLHQAIADDYHVGNMKYPLKDGRVSEGSQLLITSSSNNNISMLQHELIAIKFEDRDALLEALCLKVFGAKPTYTNDAKH
jgi:hypothetical protein